MPAAVARLAALGVRPAGHPLRGIRYLDASHRADARFRRGDGLGVRRTTLHAALAARAAALGDPGPAGPGDVRSPSRRRRGHGGGPAGPLPGRRRRAALDDPPGLRRWTRRAPAIRGSACAGTTGWRRGPTWSRCTGRRGPRRTSRRSPTTWSASPSWAARTATSRPGSRLPRAARAAGRGRAWPARCAARARCGRTCRRRSAAASCSSVTRPAISTR